MMKSKRFELRSTISTVMLGLALVAPKFSNAEVITFDLLSGNNLDPFSTYSEDNFTVMSTDGGWVEGHAFGNAVPSIVGAEGFLSSEITITENTTGLFTFTSADFADANGVGTVTYMIEGLRDGNSVFVIDDGPLNDAFLFETVVSTQPDAVVDELRIRLTSTNSLLPFNVDNISVETAAIPEPTLSVIFAALGLAVVSRRR